jgi:hypothetical protein
MMKNLFLICMLEIKNNFFPIGRRKKNGHREKKNKKKMKRKKQKIVKKYKNIFCGGFFLDENNNITDDCDTHHYTKNYSLKNINEIMKTKIKKYNPFGDNVEIFIFKMNLTVKILNKLLIFDSEKKELLHELNNVKRIEFSDCSESIIIFFENESVGLFGILRKLLKMINTDRKLKLEKLHLFMTNNPFSNYFMQYKGVGWAVANDKGKVIMMKNVDEVFQKSSLGFYAVSNGITYDLKFDRDFNISRTKLFDKRLQDLKSTQSGYDVGYDDYDDIFIIGRPSFVFGEGKPYICNENIKIVKPSSIINKQQNTIKQLIIFGKGCIFIVSPIVHVDHYKGMYIICDVYSYGFNLTIDKSVKKMDYVCLFKVPERKNFKEKLFSDIHRNHDIAFDYFYE